MQWVVPDSVGGRARGHGNEGASRRTWGGQVKTGASEPIPMGARAPGKVGEPILQPSPSRIFRYSASV